MVKFRFEALGGNNLFIDNIQILHPDILEIDTYLAQTTTIYPNPTTGIINIKSELQIHHLEIYNTIGQTVLSEFNKNWIEFKRTNCRIFVCRSK